MSNRMKRKPKVPIICFIVTCVMIVFCLSASAVTAQEKEFRLAHDDYKPFHWYSKEENKSVGIFIDICEEILHKGLDYKVIYKEYPWKRAQKMVNDGEFDAYISTPTPERLNYVVVGTEPFIVLSKVPFTQPDNPMLTKMHGIKSLDDLKSYKVLDYMGNGWGKKRLVEKTGLKLDYASSIDSVLKKLAAKRGDIFIEDPKIVNYNLALLGLTGQVVEVPVVFEETEFKLCVSQKSPFRYELKKIDQLIKEMKEKGSLKRILDKWK